MAKVHIRNFVKIYRLLLDSRLMLFPHLKIVQISSSFLFIGSNVSSPNFFKTPKIKRLNFSPQFTHQKSIQKIDLTPDKSNAANAANPAKNVRI